MVVSKRALMGFQIKVEDGELKALLLLGIQMMEKKVFLFGFDTMRGEKTKFLY